LFLVEGWDVGGVKIECKTFDFGPFPRVKKHLFEIIFFGIFVEFIVFAIGALVVEVCVI
jgi:hypothetical protein